jgi:hypothetical protein
VATCSYNGTEEDKEGEEEGEELRGCPHIHRMEQRTTKGERKMTATTTTTRNKRMKKKRKTK